MYDSLSDIACNEYVANQFSKAAKSIPYLCEKRDVWANKGMAGLARKRAWGVLIFPLPLQQINSTDCGIMTLKYIECLVSCNPVSVVKPDMCGLYRQIYCGQFSLPNWSDMWCLFVCCAAVFCGQVYFVKCCDET